MAAAFGKLSAPQRVAVVLRYYSGLSEAEIASAMGISEGMVKSNTPGHGSASRRAGARAGEQALSVNRNPVDES